MNPPTTQFHNLETKLFFAESKVSLFESEIRSRDKKGGRVLVTGKYLNAVSIGRIDQFGQYEHKCFASMINNEMCLAVYKDCLDAGWLYLYSSIKSEFETKIIITSKNQDVSGKCYVRM